MNILLLLQYNPYIENSATSNRFIGLINGLNMLGHIVTVAVVGGLQKKDELEVGLYNKENLKIIYLSRSNHYNGIIGRLNTYLFDDTFHQRFTYKRLMHLLQRNYDVLWLENNGLVLSLFLKTFEKIKCKTFIELNEFNDIYKQETGGNFLQKYKGVKDVKLFQRAVGRIDLFAVMTNTLLVYYKKMAKAEANFMHLPMTVDLKRFENVLPNNDYIKPYIAFTGTMANHKDGVDVLIQAFAKIADKYPQLHLYLAGFWHYDVPMQDKLIERFGLYDRIHRLGVLNRDQIPSFLCEASVLALSRPDSHQAQGGFPTKLGEYLATGNPVCVTTVGEIPDYLDDNLSAFMAKPGNVDSFADALDRALRDEANAKLVGANGRKVAEVNFDVTMQARRLQSFLNN